VYVLVFSCHSVILSGIDLLSIKIYTVMRAYIWECREVETNATGQPTRRLERDPIRRLLNAPGLASSEQNAQNPSDHHRYISGE
jgi:hypothetical protein